MNTGNCSMSSLTIASLLKLGLRDDKRPSTQHFFLVDLVELDRWVYPHPCQHSTFHTPQGWWFKYVPLETSNFVAIWCVFPVVVMSHSPEHLVVLLPIFFVQYQRLAPVICSPSLCVKFVSVPYWQLAPVFLSLGSCMQFISVLYWQLAPVFCSPGSCVRFISILYQWLAPVICRQDSDIFLAELQHSFSVDYYFVPSY
jgi:hypothetical protein